MKNAPSLGGVTEEVNERKPVCISTVMSGYLSAVYSIEQKCYCFVTWIFRICEREGIMAPTLHVASLPPGHLYVMMALKYTASS